MPKYLAIYLMFVMFCAGFSVGAALMAVILGAV